MTDSRFELFQVGRKVLFINGCNHLKAAVVERVFMDDDSVARVEVRYEGDCGTWYRCSPTIDRVTTDLVPV